MQLTQEETPKPISNERLKVNLWAVRAQQRKFGISFIVPDRVAMEICSKTKIRGKHPIRITRFPPGGFVEFHNIMEEAKQQTPPLKNWDKEKYLNPKKGYHKTRFNDWHLQVFYQPTL